MKNKQSNTPLLSGVLNYANEEVTCFDVPGHKRGNYLKELSEIWSPLALKMDVNASKKVDNLTNPRGIIKESEELLAEAYNADHAYMLVNGSTSGVQYMIMSAIGNGDKILLPRNVHKSAINALILAGAKPVFVQPQVNTSYGIAEGISAEDVRYMLDLHPDIKAVFVIHPTYFGAISPIESIIEIAHEHRVPVLVDQAHGAHFGFHPVLPVSATQLGADLVTISMHKTGGSLTQSSVLFHNEGLVCKDKVRSTINLFQTTSASYLLMCSIDLARKKLALEGEKRLERLLNIARTTSDEINAIPGLACLTRPEGDCLKLVIKVDGLGLSGFCVYELLADCYHIQLELGEPQVVLAIITFGDNEKSVKVLVEALKDISKKKYKSKKRDSNRPSLGLHQPKMLLTPREAYDHPKKMVPIEEAEGHISGESIMIYPPGIPLIIPGELITREMIEHYLYLKLEGVRIINDHQDDLSIKILDRSQEEQKMDLWYTENHQEDTRFSIKVKEQLHSEKSEFQQKDFFRSETFGTFFTLDGLMMVTEKDEFIYHDMITHIPMAVNPDIKRVLIIGGGDGGTAREVLRYDTIEKVDMVEIDERVVRLCQQYLPQTASQLDQDKRLHLYFEDGLKFVNEAKDASYDLILVDSTDPIGPGEGLFTLAFYKGCQRILSEEGILINQHESPYYKTYAQEMKRAHSKIRETFPISKVYQFHMPTYPSGHWLFGFASKKYDPIKDLKKEKWEELKIKTKYYNTDLHTGCFMLPTYVKEALENV